MDLFGFHKHGDTAEDDGSKNGSPAIQPCVYQAANDKPTLNDDDAKNKSTSDEVTNNLTPTTDKPSSSQGSSTGSHLFDNGCPGSADIQPAVELLKARSISYLRGEEPNKAQLLRLNKLFRVINVCVNPLQDVQGASDGETVELRMLQSWSDYRVWPRLDRDGNGESSGITDEGNTDGDLARLVRCEYMDKAYRDFAVHVGPSDHVEIELASDVNDLLNTICLTLI